MAISTVKIFAPGSVRFWGLLLIGSTRGLVRERARFLPIASDPQTQARVRSRGTLSNGVQRSVADRLIQHLVPCLLNSHCCSRIDPYTFCTLLKTVQLLRFLNFVLHFALTSSQDRRFHARPDAATEPSGTTGPDCRQPCSPPSTTWGLLKVRELQM